MSLTHILLSNGFCIYLFIFLSNIIYIEFDINFIWYNLNNVYCCVLLRDNAYIIQLQYNVYITIS